MSDISRLLSPNTIAVIGGKECDRVIEQCDKLGFSGTIWPVHPARETMRGRPCFKSVAQLPAAPDAAYVAVNREASIEVVKALSRRGAGGAVCYAAGFAEADAESEGSEILQQRLVAAAGDMPIIGPNCYGYINALEGVALWPDQHGVEPSERGVAILTQSSNVAINLTMQKRGLPIATVMTVGNQAQQGLSDLGIGLLSDERVTTLGLHIEGLDDVKAFEKLAFHARDLNKPIVAIKVGKSDQAQAAALTHTASLAGSDIAHDALFQRLGIARVHSVETFLETLKLLHTNGPLEGNELLSLSCSGGEASLMADAAHNKKVVYRPYTDEQVADLTKQLGDLVAIANPLDYNTFIWGDWPGLIRMFEAALAPRFDLSFLVMDFPRNDRCDAADWRNATNSFVAAVKQTGAKAAVVSSMPECMPEEMAKYLMSVGIVPLCGLNNAIEAAEAAAFIGQAWQKTAPAPLLETTKKSAAEAKEQKTVTLDELASKAELSKSGLVVPKSVLATDMNEIEQALITLERPLAVKALGIAHKSEVGAVALNLHTNEDVILAIQKMARLSDRFLIEEMAGKPLAELIIGVTRDPVVGLVMTVGAGGVLTELLQDTASILLPATETNIRTALFTLRIGALLEGYRNSDAADIDALIANILCIAQYACDNAEDLEELDVNPLFAGQFGSVAVDALIVKRT